MDLEQEKAFAQKNIENLISKAPPRLLDKEERFAQRLERSKKKPAKKLETLYSFMAELYEYASLYTPCKKGCADCCHYSVTISEIEIQHIEKHTRAKRKRDFLPNTNFHGTACPFLKEGSCSIYEARPFVCRRHVTLTKTNTWCAPSISNNETFPLLKFTSADEAFDDIRRESKSFEMYDIRQVFGDSSPKKESNPRST